MSSSIIISQILGHLRYMEPTKWAKFYIEYFFISLKQREPLPIFDTKERC